MIAGAVYYDRVGELTRPRGESHGEKAGGSYAIQATGRK
jgi:hypothetical protein